MTAKGCEGDLVVYSDADFAGADTKSQNGLVIAWAGSIITWRSSRAALSALSTAEAELCAAALGSQVTEGVRYLLNTLGIYPNQVEIMIDNRAALRAASFGATWRTRYYAVRAKRLLEESQQGRVKITHCPTKEMVADALTKLAAAEVIQVLIEAMTGNFPTRAVAHRTSVTPGPANRGDIAGDGPAPVPVQLPDDVVDPGLPKDHPMWAHILEALNRKWAALEKVSLLPSILKKNEGKWYKLYISFVRHHKLSKDDVQKVIDEGWDDAPGTLPRQHRQATAPQGSASASVAPVPPSPPPPVASLASSSGDRAAAAEPGARRSVYDSETVRKVILSYDEPQQPAAAEFKEEDEAEEEANPESKLEGKKRRGKKRCRPGSTERRRAALERAETQVQFQ